MQETKSFVTFGNQRLGELFDDSKNKDFPIKYYNVINGVGVKPKKKYSYYIYAYEGNMFLKSGKDKVFAFPNGMYASVHGRFSLIGVGKAIVIEVLNDKSDYYKNNDFRAMFMIGGKIEEQGRLKYIDGCTDSLLIPPIKKGDPCLNHLHFPKEIDQTQHTHPTHRIGIVARGSGLCKTPFGNLPLEAGMIFIIKAWDGVSYSEGTDGKTYPDGQHAFQTFTENMDVIAFHPDSDFGATDEVHPMINRTIVDGVSASELDEIRTK